MSILYRHPSERQRKKFLLENYFFIIIRQKFIEFNNAAYLQETLLVHKHNKNEITTNESF